ncbi:MAG: hypothetical protein ACRD9R_17165, partial [Pyrinomonadaceae bacterium]
VLRRLVALRRDPSLAAEFGDVASSAARAYATQAEAIWTRLYVYDGVLHINGDRFRFTAEARSATKLSATLAQLLGSLFARRYPQHPIFNAPLGEDAAARLVGHLLSGSAVGADAGGTDVQTLARLYAAPLGLAARRSDGYTLEVGEDALKYPWVKQALARVEEAKGELVPLAAVRRVLRGEPFGLLRESQHLVIAVLVAQRRIELITVAGEGLNRRTLHSHIDWGAVRGARLAVSSLYDAERLTSWARLLTGRDGLVSITTPEGHDGARAALVEWFEVWRARAVLEKFLSAPDAGLTTRAWELAAAVRHTFGTVAEAAEAALADDISLEEALQRMADAFADSPEQFALGYAQFEELEAYTDALAEREHARAYLTAADPTGVEEIESARRELLRLSEDVHALFDAAPRERFARLWQAFHDRYAAYYAEAHERAVALDVNTGDGGVFDDLTRGDQWREFEALSQLPFVSRAPWEEAMSLLTGARGAARCRLPVRQLLAEQPRCACSFSLNRAAAESPAEVAAYLEELSARGRETARRTLAFYHSHLARTLELLAREAPDSADAEARAQRLAESFAKNQNPSHFTHADTRLIARVLEQHPAPQPLRVPAPFGGYGLMTRDELAGLLGQWLEELPANPILVELLEPSRSEAA